MYNMSKNNKVVKYKVINTNIDKKFIGKDLDLQKVKAKGGPGGDGGRKPASKNRMTLDKLAKIVTDGFERQEKFNTRMEKEVSNLRSDLNRIVKLNNLKH